ncbi:IclR family transcriptional regulator [Sphingomonas carotinifaciens]|uniref:IclR family transcriptional regulator n=1 Tax=Sphingomonas TaxID=13687 RepID=UPI000DD9E2B6|nr:MULTISPECIES: IclR family transcriptional regulator [Sphingomonas]
MEDGILERDGKRLYRAPALEKGLDILELLAGEEQPLTVSAIVQRLGRSTGELFRMIQVLEHRGFVEQGPAGYVMTPRLFHLGLKRPPVRSMLEQALPIMRQLTIDIGQSCHLGIQTGSDMAVVARMESTAAVGFAVRVGYRQPLHRTSSGAVLYAFQSPSIRGDWERSFQPAPSADELNAFRARADEIRVTGLGRQDNPCINGMRDLSAPILRGRQAIAALTVPFLRLTDSTVSEDAACNAIRAAAAEISSSLAFNDSHA